jgi:hypothetical protein
VIWMATALKIFQPSGLSIIPYAAVLEWVCSRLISESSYVQSIWIIFFQNLWTGKYSHRVFEHHIISSSLPLLRNCRCSETRWEACV